MPVVSTRLWSNLSRFWRSASSVCRKLRTRSERPRQPRSATHADALGACSAPVLHGAADAAVGQLDELLNKRSAAVPPRAALVSACESPAEPRTTRLASPPASCTSARSMPRPAPNSLTTTATRRPWLADSTCDTSVLFPAPRKPVMSVTCGARTHQQRCSVFARCEAHRHGRGHGAACGESASDTGAAEALACSTERRRGARAWRRHTAGCRAAQRWSQTRTRGAAALCRSSQVGPSAPRQKRTASRRC